MSSTNNLYEKSWVYTPGILFTSSKLKEFIPTNDMSYVEKLNAMTRFIIYASILIFLVLNSLSNPSSISANSDFFASTKLSAHIPSIAL